MKNKSGHIVLISLIVALGGFLMGFDASVISGVVKFIEPEFNLSKIELGWAVSSLTLTATLAMMIAGPLSDRWGRKRVLSMAAVLYALSAILSAIAPTFVFLVIARMLGGFGVGASLIIAPMYIAEIAPPKSRGRMVSFNQLNIVIGISAAFFTNYLILKYSQSGADWTKAIGLDTYNWRYMLGLEAVPAILYFVALFVVPRSPRWLIMKGKDQEAFAIMKKANGEQVAALEIKAVKQSLESDTNKEKVKLKEIFSPVLRTVLTIGIVLAALQQLTGINSVFFYAPMIFEQTGLGVDASFSQAIYVGLTNLVFTIIAMALIDRIGRKPLLIFGVSGIVISMFVLAYGFNAATFSVSDETIEVMSSKIDDSRFESIKNIEYLSDVEFKSALSATLGESDALKYESEIMSNSIQLNSMLILIAIIAFVASFAISIGPVMWVMFSELFPNRVRAIAISFVGFINSVVSFMVQLVFPWELANIGTSATFLIYGSFAAIGLIFIIMKVPETKGKSLEDLQALFISNNNKNSNAK